jgi:putative inorganic carbon (HCO3(-)) transporter
VTLGIGYFSLYAPPEITNRIDSVTQGEARQQDGRTTIWMVGWRMVEDNPIRGVGAGNFEDKSVNYVLEPGTTYRTDRVIDRPGVSHNSYLGPLAELGIVGALLFVSIIGFSVLCAWRAANRFARAEDLPMEALARGVVVASVGMLAAGFFISAEASKQIWLLLALGPALLTIAATRDDDQRTS